MRVISLRNPSAAVVALLVTTSATRATIELDSFNLNRNSAKASAPHADMAATFSQQIKSEKEREIHYEKKSLFQIRHF